MSYLAVYNILLYLLLVENKKSSIFHTIQYHHLSK